eukprot:386506-Rhodomonas_salina.1
MGRTWTRTLPRLNPTRDRQTWATGASTIVVVDSQTWATGTSSSRAPDLGHGRYTVIGRIQTLQTTTLSVQLAPAMRCRVLVCGL